MKRSLLPILFFLLCCITFPVHAASDGEVTAPVTLHADICSLTSPVTAIGESKASISTRAAVSNSSASISNTSSISTKQVNALYKTLKSFKTSVNLSSYKIKNEDMQTLLNKAFTKDYYIQDAISSVYVNYNYNYYGYVTTVKINYTYSTSTMKKRYNGLKSAVATAKKAIGTNLSDEEAAVAIHNYIIKLATFRTDYATRLEQNPNLAPVYNYHSAYGILCKKTGVCSGYAYAYRILLDEYGIDSVFIESAAMNHGWNMIKLNKSWYHVDVTWDDPDANIQWTEDGSGDLIYYTFFLLNNQEMQIADHYSWSPTKKSVKTTYSNMPRYSSDEQLFYKGNWYMIETSDQLYQYIKYTMKGKKTILSSSVIPYYRLDDRIIYQPDACSLMSANLDGSMIRDLSNLVILQGVVPENMAYTVQNTNNKENTITLQYEAPITDETPAETTLYTKNLLMTDYELRTSDYASSLTLSKSRITIKKGKYATLKASIGPDWPLLNDKVTFYVSKAGKKIISVKKQTAFNCRFKGIKKGTATIMVTVPNTTLKKTCKVTVK